MFLWAMQISGSKISWLTSLSKPTKWVVRSICSNKILNAEIKLGGLRKTMEIDESKFGDKGKLKRGRVSEGPWVFSGLWSKGSRKCWSSVFPTELERHMCIILSHILPGTTIYSNQFTLYILLNQLGYIHLLMITPRTLLSLTVVHTPIPSKAFGP